MNESMSKKKQVSASKHIREKILVEHFFVKFNPIFTFIILGSYIDRCKDMLPTKTARRI